MVRDKSDKGLSWLLVGTAFCLFVAIAGTALAGSETATLTKTSTLITFNASAMFPGLQLTGAFWDFSDDTNDSGLVVTHSYVFDGVYQNGSVTATDDDGGRHVRNLTVIVGGSVPFVSQEAPYVAFYFPTLPSGIFQLTVNQTDSSSLSTAGFDIGGKFFNITSDLPNGAFSAQLVFSYDDSDDNGIVDGTSNSENSLGVYYYNNSWVQITDAVLNTTGNSITATANHFTLFGLLATQAPSPSPGPSPAPSSGSSGGGGGGGGGVGAAKKPAAGANATKLNTTNATKLNTTNATANAVPNQPPVPASEAEAATTANAGAPSSTQQAATTPKRPGLGMKKTVAAVGAAAIILIDIVLVVIYRRKKQQQKDKRPPKGNPF